MVSETRCSRSIPTSSGPRCSRKSCLKDARWFIVPMTMTASVAGGHAFNVDGYTEARQYLSCQLGLERNRQRDFALNAFSYKSYTFNIEQQMIIGLQPPITTPTIMATPYQLDMTGYVDQRVVPTLSSFGANA